MITVMESFRVPAVPYVEVYRDAGAANRFHLLTDHPRVAVDDRTGLPLFSYTLFSRNIEIVYASAQPGQPVESQLGALTVTCDLSIPREDWDLIHGHCAQVLAAELNQPSTYNKLYKTNPTSAEPTLGYANTWTSGSVRLELLKDMPGTFVRSTSADRAPQLRGTMAASLWANLGIEGSQLLWDALKPDGNPTTATGSSGPTQVPLLANVTYELTGVARCPALHVEVKANGGPIYKELRERMQISEIKDGQSWSYPQLKSLVKGMVDERLITIDWKDYGVESDPAANELKKKLQDTVLSLVTNKIIETFFRQLQTPGLKEEDLGKTFTHTTNSVPGSRLWLDEYTESNLFDLSFTLNYESNHTFKAYPQTSLLGAFTPEQRRACVRVLDVGSPEVRVLSVPVLVNADWTADKIANITTTLSYRQFDHLVQDWIEHADTFVFRTGQEAFTFRTRLARDAQGRLIDRYDAKGQINYIARQPEPPVELHNLSERALTFSYDRLGFVNVTVEAGDIDWTEIHTVWVDLVYEPARSQPDAHGSVKLTKDVLEGRWTSSKHGFSGGSYHYEIRFLRDGAELMRTSGSDERGTLVIHDPLTSKLRKTFDVSLDPATVQAVVLTVRHEDASGEPHDTHQVFTATESWDYSRALSEGASRTLKYRYIVQYKDGLSDDPEWVTLSADEDPPTIEARRSRVPMQIDGSGLNWSKWRTAYLTVSYSDAAHGYELVEELRISSDNPFLSVDALAFSPRQRTFRYRALLVARDGSDPIEVPAADAEPIPHTGVLLLETLI